LTIRTLTKNSMKKELTLADRCDACGSQAYVWVNGVTGDLLFCSHHYTKIMNDPSGKAAMESFAFEVVDERSRISDKRAGL
jgi:hypothetical protein